MATASFRPGFAKPRRRQAKAQRQCMACLASTNTVWKWLCDACFGLLPFDRKKGICEARERREPQRVFGLSRDAADWLAAQRSKLAGE